MEGPRACRREEREKVINLIDSTFRTPNGFSPSMGEEFKLLLGEGNLENMRLILEDGEPVADVNFYKSTILIEGTPVKAASIGAVCTAANSRGKGYSSIILDDCEKLMKEDNVRLMLVSGTRSLYTRRGCVLAGKCYEFTLEASEDKHENIQLEEFQEELLPEMIKLYNKESTRYYRTYEEFKYLLSGATTPWGNFTYKTYLVKAYGEYCAYIVLRLVNHKEGPYGVVVEAAGDRDMIYSSIQNIISLNSLRHIRYFCTYNDPSTQLLKRKNISFKELNLMGTVKILDFEGFMKDLTAYFSQFIDANVLKNIEFKQTGDRYILSYKGESIEFDDIHDLTRLIFGSREAVERDFSNKTVLNEFIRTVFPLPFVWTANVNYQ